VARYDCLPVCLSIIRQRPAKSAGRIEVFFGTKTPCGPRNTELDGYTGFDAVFVKLLLLLLFSWVYCWSVLLYFGVASLTHTIRVSIFKILHQPISIMKRLELAFDFRHESVHPRVHVYARCVYGRHTALQKTWKHCLLLGLRQITNLQYNCRQIDRYIMSSVGKSGDNATTAVACSDYDFDVGKLSAFCAFYWFSVFCIIFVSSVWASLPEIKRWHGMEIHFILNNSHVDLYRFLGL